MEGHALKNGDDTDDARVEAAAYVERKLEGGDMEQLGASVMADTLSASRCAGAPELRDDSGDKNKKLKYPGVPLICFSVSGAKFLFSRRPRPGTFLWLN